MRLPRASDDSPVTDTNYNIRYKVVSGKGTLYVGESDREDSTPVQDLTVHQSANVFLKTNGRPTKFLSLLLVLSTQRFRRRLFLNTLEQGVALATTTTRATPILSRFRHRVPLVIPVKRKRFL